MLSVQRMITARRIMTEHLTIQLLLLLSLLLLLLLLLLGGGGGGGSGGFYGVFNRRWMIFANKNMVIIYSGQRKCVYFQ